MGVSLYLVLNNKVLRPAKRLRLLILSIVFLIYLIAGAYIFILINLPIELQERKDIIEFKKNFLQNHKCISQDEIEDFINLITDAADSGIVFVENSTEFTQNWILGGETLFFTFTLLATIGYGYAHPLTQNGKLFCIFYITFGVPLTMLLLTLIVDRLEFKLTKNLTRTLNSAKKNHNKYLSKEYSTLSETKTNPERYSPIKRNNYLLSFKIGLILLIFIYLIPAFIMTNITELHWTLLDALYYCYISVTTIGFGDLVPGEDQIGNKRNLYRLLMTVYLMIGIIVNMLFLNILIRLPIVFKIQNSWLKLKRRRLFEYREIEEEKDSEEIASSSNSRDASPVHSRSVTPRNMLNNVVNDTVETVSDLDSIDVVNRISRNNNNLFSKTKNV